MSTYKAAGEHGQHRLIPNLPSCDKLMKWNCLLREGRLLEFPVAVDAAAARQRLVEPLPRAHEKRPWRAMTPLGEGRYRKLWYRTRSAAEGPKHVRPASFM